MDTLIYILANIQLGKTVPIDGLPDDDLDIETLTKDLEDLLGTLFPNVEQAPSFLVRFPTWKFVKPY